MNHLDFFSSAMRERLSGMADRLFGCSHHRTTFPFTTPAKASAGDRPRGKPETYVVCLECGRHFLYDWSGMRVTKKEIASAESRAGLGSPFGGS